jgi:hypothetical protein
MPGELRLLYVTSGHAAMSHSVYHLRCVQQQAIAAVKRQRQQRAVKRQQQAIAQLSLSGASLPGHDCCVESGASHRSCHADKCTLPCGRPPMHSILPDAYVALHMHACSCTLTCLAELQVCSGRVWSCLCYGVCYRLCGLAQPCL